METGFQELFGRAPESTAWAPGRVNLLGEHTDYNDGFVLPTAISLRTCVEVARAAGDRFRIHSADLGEAADWAAGDAAPPGFGRYAYGCVRVLQRCDIDVPPVVMRIESTVPIGRGLSSSASLEVAVLRALRALLRLSLDDVRIALLARQAEVEFTGVRCGILDQMAVSLCEPREMLFLDTRTLDRRTLDMPPDSEMLVLDSGVPRRLESSAYNRRREECEDAARRLGVTSLRDVADTARWAELPPPLDRRARHVFTENERVLRAAGGVDAAAFGGLMSKSHESLRDDFEVSTPGLDSLVALLQAHPQVYGARLTGAGFGGACVALVRGGAADAVAGDVLLRFGDDGGRGTRLV
jgi:galactokinase